MWSCKQVVRLFHHFLANILHWTSQGRIPQRELCTPGFNSSHSCSTLHTQPQQFTWGDIPHDLNISQQNSAPVHCWLERVGQNSTAKSSCPPDIGKSLSVLTLVSLSPESLPIVIQSSWAFQWFRAGACTRLEKIPSRKLLIQWSVWVLCPEQKEC